MNVTIGIPKYQLDDPDSSRSKWIEEQHSISTVTLESGVLLESIEVFNPEMNGDTEIICAGTRLKQMIITKCHDIDYVRNESGYFIGIKLNVSVSIDFLKENEDDYLSVNYKLFS